MRWSSSDTLSSFNVIETHPQRVTERGAIQHKTQEYPHQQATHRILRVFLAEGGFGPLDVLGRRVDFESTLAEFDFESTLAEFDIGNTDTAVDIVAFPHGDSVTNLSQDLAERKVDIDGSPLRSRLP
jgi:hypothetical protein